MADSVVFAPEPTGPDAPQVPQNDAGNGERPGWLPENFKTPEDFAKSAADTRAELTRVQQELAELRKKATEVKPNDPPKSPDEGEKKDEVTTPEGEKLKIEDEAPKGDAPPIDFKPYFEEFAKTGDVSEDNRAVIADKLKGVFGENARAVVDDYIRGSQTRVQSNVDAGMQIAGGAENYTAMTKWAAANLSPEAKAHYNQAVNSGNYAAMELAIAGLKSKWESAVGKTPSLITGASGAASADTFTSLAEAKKAMADPRYAKDAAYREEVAAKLRRTQMGR